MAVLAPEAPAARRSGRLTLTLFIVLLVIGLLIAADRFGVEIAERRAATSLQQQLSLGQPPDVDIKGIPFLNQLIASEFSHVTVSADAVQVVADAGPLTIDHLDLDLTGVRPSRGYHTFAVSRLTGSATLGWSALQQLTGTAGITFASVDSAGQGRIALTVSTSLLGQKVTAIVTAVPVLNEADQTIELTTPALTVAGMEIPAELTQRLLAQLIKPIPLGIPYGVTASRLTVSTDGAALLLVGQDLTFGQ